MADTATAPPARKKYRAAPSAARAITNGQQEAKGVKIGRPRTYSPELCEIAVALGHKGKSWAGIAAAFGISRATLNVWESEFPAFSDALARARAASQAWWEAHGQRNLKADRYQAQVHRNIMAAQFEDYREAAGPSVTIDLGSALEALESRRSAGPGASAKPVQPLDVVVSEPDNRAIGPTRDQSRSK